MSVRLSRRKIADYCAKELLAGKDSKKLATTLAAYLIESSRTKELDAILSDIDFTLSTQGVVSAKVSSAHELDENTRSMIKRLIERETDARQVTLDSEVDPALLGGFRLEFAGLELDTTMAKKLNSLKINL